MSLMRQDEIGTGVKRPIAVKLRDGDDHGRVAVRDILGTSRADPGLPRRS